MFVQTLNVNSVLKNSFVYHCLKLNVIIIYLPPIEQPLGTDLCFSLLLSLKSPFECK